MKIEISEVFVTHTDAITLHVEPTPVGIAALEPRPTATTATNKMRLQWLCTALYGFLSPKPKDVTHQTPIRCGNPSKPAMP